MPTLPHDTGFSENGQNELRIRENFRRAAKKLDDLQAEVGGGGPPTGPAGGELSGNYPDPTIANNVITSAKIVNGTITNDDINAAAAIDYGKLNLSNSIVAGDIAADAVGSSEIAAGAVGTSELAQGIVVELADGSAGSPSLTNDGDENTGIFFGAADQFDIATGGTSRIQVGTTTETHTLPILGANGSASATAFQTRAAGNGMYSSAASTLDFASAGTRAVGITSTEFQVQSTRNIRCFGGITLNRVTGTTSKPQYTDLTGGDPVINTGSGINSSIKTWDVDDGTHFDNSSITPRLLFCESEIMVCTAASGNTITNAERGQCGTSAASHADATPIYDYDTAAVYGNVLIPTNSFRLSLTLSPLTADIYVWTPPRAAIGSWSAPADTTTYEVAVDDCNGYVVHLMEPNTGGELATFSRAAGSGIGFEIAFDSSAGKYNIRSSYGEV